LNSSPSFGSTCCHHIRHPWNGADIWGLGQNKSIFACFFSFIEIYDTKQLIETAEDWLFPPWRNWNQNPFIFIWKILIHSCRGRAEGGAGLLCMGGSAVGGFAVFMLMWINMIDGKKETKKGFSLILTRWNQGPVH